MENINEIITEIPIIKKRGRPAKSKIKETKIIKLPTKIDSDKRIFYYERSINNKKQGKIYKYFKPKDKHLITNKEFTRQLILKTKELFNHEKRDEIDQNKIISLYNQIDDLLKSLTIN